MIVIDTAELRALADQLGRVGDQMHAEVTKVVKRGAMNIKRQMTAEMQSSRHFRSIAGSVNFDFTTGRNGIEAQVGPDKGRGGALANIAYFGTSRGGGTVPDPRGALEAEAPRLEAAIMDALRGLL